MLRSIGILFTAAAVGCQGGGRPWSHVDTDQLPVAGVEDAGAAAATVALNPSPSPETGQTSAAETTSIADAGTAELSVEAELESVDPAFAGSETSASASANAALAAAIPADTKPATPESADGAAIVPVGFADEESPAGPELTPEPLLLPDLAEETEETDADADGAEVDGDVIMGAPVAAGPVELDDVIASVYAGYPLLEAAFLSRTVAEGQQISASGEFDLKLKASSENRALGYFKTFRQHVGFVQPTWQGGEFYGGYRVGQGEFAPWYLERQTNEGGEFKAGFAVPFAQNRNIDARRGGLMKADIERQLVEPDIHAQLIGFVQEASYAYWDWVAAGEKYRIAARILELAEDRSERIRRQVEEGLIDPPELTDNLRLVAERRAKLRETERKREQTAIKLSLYLRDADGSPLVPPAEWLPAFPPLERSVVEHVELDAQQALEWRPELNLIDFKRRELQVELALAENELRPHFAGTMEASKDVGQPTSPSNYKGPFELEAGVVFEVPLQRRKATGKIHAVQGKMAQLTAKRRLVEDKIVAEVGQAAAGVRTAFEQAREAEQAVAYAEELAQRERRNLELGASDLLKVSLREQYAVEAALKAIDAKLEYYRSRADYRAALGQDQLP